MLKRKVPNLTKIEIRLFYSSKNIYKNYTVKTYIFLIFSWFAGYVIKSGWTANREMCPQKAQA